MDEPIAASPAGSGRWLPSVHLGEARLARRAAEGDPRAFAAIFERHGQEIYRYCLAILGDRHDAQDALQSTMANALRALPGERREISLRPWLFRVAHNEAITLARQRRATVDSDSVLELTEQGADATAADRERLRTLVSDLGSLPERQRSALVMQELSGMSHSEVAGALDISPGAARQAVYEGRAALLEIGEGREMECDRVRKTISARDGRMLRGRKVRAHLRACDGCQDFLAAIDQRRSDFAALFPPLPAAAAASILAGLTGGAAGGGTVAGGAGAAGAAGGGAITGGGGASGAVGAGGLGALSAKGAATLAAAAVLGTGVAGYSGAIDIPLPGKADEGSSPGSTPGSSASSAGDASAGHAAGAGAGSRSAGQGNAKDHANGSNRRGGGNRGDRQVNGDSGGTGTGTASNGSGASEYTPGVGGATAPGQGGTPPGQANGAPSPPPQANGTPQGGRATAPGQSSDKPPKDE